MGVVRENWVQGARTGNQFHIYRNAGAGVNGRGPKKELSSKFARGFWTPPGCHLFQASHTECKEYTQVITDTDTKATPESRLQQI